MPYYIQQKLFIQILTIVCLYQYPYDMSRELFLNENLSLLHLQHLTYFRSILAKMLATFFTPGYPLMFSKKSTDPCRHSQFLVRYSIFNSAGVMGFAPSHGVGPMAASRRMG